MVLFFSGDSDAGDVLMILDNLRYLQRICRNDEFTNNIGVLISELYAEHSTGFQESRNTCNQRC